MKLRPVACRALPVVASLLLLSGCAAPANSANAIMDRVDQHRAEYDAWPLPVKEAVLDGRVAKGMTPTMVEVALGRPDEVVARDNGDEAWIYKIRNESSSSSSAGPLGGLGSISIGGSVGGGGGYYGGGPSVGVSSAPIVLGGGGGGSGYGESTLEREIWFRGGVVVRGDDVKDGTTSGGERPRPSGR